MSNTGVIETPKENQSVIVQEIPLDRIRPSSANPRQSMDSTGLKELADSIKAHGVLQPILVRPIAGGHFEIVCGERRYRAASTAGRSTIPARIVSLSDAEALETATIENLLREDLHELEESEAYAKMLGTNAGYTPEILSHKLGKSVAHIYRRLQLLKLDPKLKQYFLDGQMTAAHALILARLQPADQKELLSQLNQAAKKGAVEFPSVAHLQAWVQENIFLSLNGAPFNKDDAALVPEAGPCTTCPKRTGFNPMLFPEVKQKDQCTDRVCFAGKLNAFVELKLKQAPPGTVKISTSWRFAGESKVEGVLSRDQYREPKKDACDHTVPPLWLTASRSEK